MVEEILPGLYRIEVPLPNSPLRSINSYVIKAQGRSLVIDSGFSMPKCLKVWQDGLDEIGLHKEDVDFFLTHYHSDHIALAAVVASDVAKLYIGEYDEPIASNAFKVTRINDLWQLRAEYMIQNGFPRAQFEGLLKQSWGFEISPAKQPSFTPLREGARIDIGNYHFTCIRTQGHTEGHLCLYEPEKKLLLSGDHILGDITPSIASWQDEGNPLGDYLESLTKIERLDVKLVLPGHRSIVRDPKRRIAELRSHHQARLDEVLNLLQQSEQTAYEVASKMTWDIQAENWDSFPVAQQWFATAEAMSHLRHLISLGIVKCDERGSRVIYSAN